MSSHFTTLATSGCSIVVVYSVWDRVVRVRFPAPRQIQITPVLGLVLFVFVGESTQTTLRASGIEQRSDVSPIQNGETVSCVPRSL